eukprot:c6275_g1_i1.p1 GENE.c6275_g1_i1~~c6275_g1_i1.p1  ORF type:complete len:369 (+),score=63.30 c6275_g1_i1:1-1107(+)
MGGDSRMSSGLCVVIGVVPAVTDTQQRYDLKQLEADIKEKYWPSSEFRWGHSKPWKDEDHGDVDVLLISFTLSAGSQTSESDVIQTIQSMSQVELADVWITCPSFVPFSVVTLESISFSTDQICSDITLSTFSELGVIGLRGGVCPDVKTLYEASQVRIAETKAAIDQFHPEIHYGSDNFAFLEIGSRGGNRFDLLFRADDPLVSQFAWNAPWIPLITHFLGHPSTLHCLSSIIYSLPLAPNQSWHSDGPHLSASQIHNGPASPPYAICVFLPLIDLSPTVGFTQFWPTSHKSDGLIGFGSAAELLGATVDGIVGAGDCVIYDYRLMHRGMGNFSDIVRPVLQFVYHVDSYREVKNYGTKSVFEPPTM